MTGSKNDISDLSDQNIAMIIGEISNTDEYLGNLEFRRWFILLVFALIQ